LPPPFMHQTPLDLQIFIFSFFLDLVMELSKPDYTEQEIEVFDFYNLTKFSHQ
jgi:hypothetical protein